MTEQNEELPVVAVRTKYENSPYGWSYHEDAEYGKYSNAKREKLYRHQDVEQLIAEAVPTDEELDKSPYCECEADRAEDGTIIDVEICSFHSGMMEMQKRLLEEVQNQ